MPSIEQKGTDALISARVQPKASRDTLRIETAGRIRITVTAPPVNGQANKAVSDFVAKTLGIPKRAVTLVQGLSSRQKTFLVEGLTADEVRKKLNAQE